jgi:hypothetical protein
VGGGQIRADLGQCRGSLRAPADGTANAGTRVLQSAAMAGSAGVGADVRRRWAGIGDLGEEEEGGGFASGVGFGVGVGKGKSE